MNKITNILLGFIAIFLSAYFLYWQGEVAIDKASGKFTAIGFENTNLNCNASSLEFFIENNKHLPIDYQIEFSLDDKEFSSQTIPISPSEKKIIKLDSKMIAEICQKEPPFKFKVSVKTDQENQIIYKIIVNIQ